LLNPAASKIFEDEHVLVFMPLPPGRWFGAPGHVLVVPKRMCANVLDLKPDELRGLMSGCKKLASPNARGSELPVIRVSRTMG